MVLNISALVVTLAAGLVLALRFPINYYILFIGAAILGVASTSVFRQIPFPPPARKEAGAGGSAGVRFAGFVKAALQNKDFVNYGISAVIWNFGVTFLGSLTAVYFVQDLEEETKGPGLWLTPHPSPRRLSASGIGGR